MISSYDYSGKEDSGSCRKKEVLGKLHQLSKLCCEPTDQFGFFYESGESIFDTRYCLILIFCDDNNDRSCLYSSETAHLLLPCHGDCGVDGVQALTQAVGVHGVVVLV